MLWYHACLKFERSNNELYLSDTSSHISASCCFHKLELNFHDTKTEEEFQGHLRREGMMDANSIAYSLEVIIRMK